MIRRVHALWATAAFATALFACNSAPVCAYVPNADGQDAPPAFVDLNQCRCGDGTYGYQQCVVDSSGHATYQAVCNCTIGLSPDAGPPPGEPDS